MLKNIIGSAIGREKADTVFKNAGVFDVFGGKIEYADVAVKDGVIAGIGAYDRAEEVVDCAGKFLMPGFIDAHAHIESTHLTPCEFAKAVVPRGTTAVIADPHEIANVRGLAGIRYLYEESAKLPLQVKIMFPSCVPASPFDSSGAVLTAEDMERALAGGLFSGVGEFMNYPGVLACDGEVLRKLEAAKRFAMPVDGHAPGLTGRELSAYVSAGIYTEHECATVAEMEEKLSRGMYILMRQGSSTRNLLELLRGVTPRNMRRCLFCTDDKTPGELLSDGHIDNSVRMAIRFGLSPVDAVTIASLNAAECYGLRGKGAIAPGYDADILITGDAGVSAIERVYIKGVLAAENGRALFSAAPKPPASV
jgi:adenine deaminase